MIIWPNEAFPGILAISATALARLPMGPGQKMLEQIKRLWSGGLLLGHAKVVGTREHEKRCPPNAGFLF
jgi:hypothetical protein